MGKRIEDAAVALECSTAKISRLETGKGVPYARDVRDLVIFYGAEKQLDELLAVAEEGRAQDWVSNFRDVLQGDLFVDTLAPDNAGRFVYLERDADAIKTFQSDFFPGLLQHKDYVSALCSLIFPEHKDHELTRFTDFRLARQHAFRHRSKRPEYSVVLSECVILRRIGGDAVMRRQLEFLVDTLASELSFVDLRIVPLRVNVRGALNGPFTIMKFADERDQDVVHLEVREGTQYLETDDAVRRYGVLYDELVDASLGRAESIDRLAAEAALIA